MPIVCYKQEYPERCPLHFCLINCNTLPYISSKRIICYLHIPFSHFNQLLQLSYNSTLLFKRRGSLTLFFWINNVPIFVGSSCYEYLMRGKESQFYKPFILFDSYWMEWKSKPFLCLQYFWISDKILVGKKNLLGK